MTSHQSLTVESATALIESTSKKTIGQGSWMMIKGKSTLFGIGSGWTKQFVWVEEKRFCYAPDRSSSKRTELPLTTVLEARVLGLREAKEAKAPSDSEQSAWALFCTDRSVKFTCNPPHIRDRWVAEINEWVNTKVFKPSVLEAAVDEYDFDATVSCTAAKERLGIEIAESNARSREQQGDESAAWTALLTQFSREREECYERYFDRFYNETKVAIQTFEEMEEQDRDQIQKEEEKYHQEGVAPAFERSLTAAKEATLTRERLTRTLEEEETTARNGILAEEEKTQGETIAQPWESSFSEAKEANAARESALCEAASKIVTELGEEVDKMEANLEAEADERLEQLLRDAEISFDAAKESTLQRLSQEIEALPLSEEETRAGAFATEEKAFVEVVDASQCSAKDAEHRATARLEQQRQREDKEDLHRKEHTDEGPDLGGGNKDAGLRGSTDYFFGDDEWNRGSFTIFQNEMLGRGGFGTVYKAYDTYSGTFAAAKTMNGIPNCREEVEETIRDLCKEIDAVSALAHPNIVQVYRGDVTTYPPCIFMEWLPAGSVTSVMRRVGGHLTETVVARYLADALKGLAFLHKHDVLHRDIKPANMLVGQNGEVKLSDFGLCKKIVDTSSKQSTSQGGIVGTIPFLPPEAMRGKMTKAADIWAIGASAVEMISGKSPWALKEGLDVGNPVSLMFCIGTAEPPEHSPPLPLNVSDEFRNFCDRCFAFKPEDRPSCEDLLVDPFLVEGTAYSPTNPYHRRVENFFTVYAPDRFSEVLSLLKAHEGKEDALITKLTEELGPEPSSQEVANVQRSHPASPVQSGAFSHAHHHVRPPQHQTSEYGWSGGSHQASAGSGGGVGDSQGPQPSVNEFGIRKDQSVAMHTMSFDRSGSSAFTGDSLSHKERLTALYSKYDPHKLNLVDEALQVYFGREEGLFKALVKQYGPEPSPEEAHELIAAAARDPSALVSSRQTSSSTVCSGGSNSFAAARTPSTTPPPAPSLGGGRPNPYRDRLIAFYEQHAPEKLDIVASALEQYNGREEELFKALVKQYGLEPTKEEASKRQRLQYFYAVYVPDKATFSNINKALQAYNGKEEELFSALVKHYGPEPSVERGAAALAALRENRENDRKGKIEQQQQPEPTPQQSDYFSSSRSSSLYWDPNQSVNTQQTAGGVFYPQTSQPPPQQQHSSQPFPGGTTAMSGHFYPPQQSPQGGTGGYTGL